MWVYSAGVDPVKGVPPVQTIIVNPFAHLGQKAVPGSWATKGEDGKLVGREFHIVFQNGRYDADEPMAKYLLDHGYAQAEPWQPPPGRHVAGGEDPAWRWREPA